MTCSLVQKFLIRWCGPINCLTRRARCQQKSRGHGQDIMSKNDSTTTAAQTTSKSNGSNRNTADVKLDRKPTKELPAAETKKQELSIDEKIQRVQDLNDLIAKRNRFMTAKTKLNSFNLKREETTTNIVIQDQEGNQFATSHTESIEKILQVLSESINAGLAATEAKIQF